MFTELLHEGNKTTSCNQTGTIIIPPNRTPSASSVSAHLLAGTQSPIGKHFLWFWQCSVVIGKAR